ncbi:hypothetical protein TBLA_0D03180 [Henningerozyma blattae CBS 6284]|uniref:Cytochrome b5 heme-binding domain-containing protein n=1 Tax=Henningerozyma blattae (strain ATCC 34711 / CBS 6284 / DSM 70876 / NBRC 10599 / NRRL Y-10934 / UCD 77-7) TaxID=1071380 RepID=I2H366_HENB6|nr:hypothetical protein TBLA_0D03180 [Tetrapisispora blattae CBS 6284]CCH60818.1 hypothetical protein TBLA_0D03180 [Tetrapisispora blattae CBS 6284]
MPASPSTATKTDTVGTSSSPLTKELFSLESVQKHNTKKDCWVIYQNRKIYDVSQYLADYPKGNSKIIDFAGKDITSSFKNQERYNHDPETYDFMSHNDKYLVGYLANEEEAYKLLSNPSHKVEVKLTEQPSTYDSTTFVKELPSEDHFVIATDYKKDFNEHHFLDLEKPLIPQLWRAKFNRAFYIDQIHRPRHFGNKSAPLFGNFLEPLTKTAWWVIPVVWLPVVFYHLKVAFHNMNNIFATFLFCVGVFVWTLIEYSLHRFLFHMDNRIPDHPMFYVLHFTIHGCHHYLPMDPYRLVMPPTLFLILCTPFYKLVFSVLPLYWAYAGFAGGLFGYVCYDEVHYWLHHSRVPKFMRLLKKLHLEHHYKNYQLAFGVSNYFWDKVFGTYLYPDSPLSPMKYE